MISETTYYTCEVCDNGYISADALEYHLRKEHTKTDFIAYLKREAVRQMTKEKEGSST